MKLKNLLKEHFEKIIIFLFVAVIGIYIIGAILAPITRYLGRDKISDYIYWVYGFLCHQKPWRSIHIFDYQMAFCVRDLFIFVPLLIIGIISLFDKFRLKPISFLWSIIFVTPMILDSVYQLISEISSIVINSPHIYESTNFIRFLTSVLFGTAFGLYMFPTLQKEFGKEVEENNLILRRYIVISTFVASLSVYLALIFIWDKTSENYKPANFLDHEVYLPGINYEETGRKGHVR